MSDEQNPKVFGKYEVIRRIAVGGMGEIFLSRQTGMAGFDRLAILKSLLPQLASDPDMLTQFLDEARTVGCINHPNVVACFEVGEWEGVYFIAMEYINGVDVAQLQKAADEMGMRFPVHSAMTITREAALGLDSAHQATDAMGRALKIVHRDISPHNIMVRQDGLAKVVDFGVAMAANRQKRTEVGLLKGKLGYMAPEQIKGQPLDGRSDQFSLGVMLWELLAGRRLFTAEDPHSVFMKIVRETVPAPSSLMNDVPPELDAIVLKMTAQDPKDRYGRLGEAAAALRKLLDARGAMENETQDLVRDLVGAQLAERVRDLSPSPVRILGVKVREEAPLVSGQFCSACGARAVKGDRFCRSCGTPLSGSAPPPRAPTPPPSFDIPSTEAPQPGPVSLLDEDFAEIADDLIDVAFEDDASGPMESARCVLELSLVDRGVASAPGDALLGPLVAHFEEIASRFAGQVTSEGARVTATFTGNGRAARSAIGFARRASVIALRAHGDMQLRAGVSALPGFAQGSSGAVDETERCFQSARLGSVVLTDRARKLASSTHPRLEKLAFTSQDGSEVVAWRVAVPRRIAGRAAERATVEQAIAAADLGKAQQHLFLGEAGLGKSTLLELVDGEARDRGFVVARARCAAPRGPLRYDAVRQAIRSACLELLALQDTRGPWQGALDQLGIAPHDRRRLEALVDDDAADPGDDDIPLARRRTLLRAAVLSFFATLAERRGVCILLDDIHRGDPSSLELFAEIGARLNASRLAVIAAGRPMHGERVLPFAKRSVLEGLEAKDVVLAASLAVGAALPEAAAEKIASCAQGNPLFASHVARHLVDIHLLTIHDGTAEASPDFAHYPLPPSTAVLLFARHALLPSDARQALQAGAQLGAAFSLADLTVMLDEGAAVSLQVCAAAGALVDEEDGRFSFPSATEREFVAARAEPAVVAAWHRSLVGALAKVSSRSAHLAERRVLHLLAAGDHEAAADAAEQAAEAWVRLGAVEATSDHLRRALQVRWKMLSPSSSSEAAQRALDLAARATSVLGEVDAAGAVDLARPIVRLLPPTTSPMARAQALRARAGLLLKLRRTDDATAALQEVLAFLPSDAPASLRGSVLLDIALATEQAGNPEGARRQLQDALRVLASVSHETTRVGEALLALGRLQLRARDLVGARESLTQALEEARGRQSLSSQIDVLSAMASLAQAEGKGDKSLQLLDDALALASRPGDGVAEARTRQQLARTLQQLGKDAEALAAARLALSVSQRLAWDEGAAVANQLVISLERR